MAHSIKGATLQHNVIMTEPTRGQMDLRANGTTIWDKTFRADSARFAMKKTLLFAHQVVPSRPPMSKFFFSTTVSSAARRVS